MEGNNIDIKITDHWSSSEETVSGNKEEQQENDNESLETVIEQWLLSLEPVMMEGLERPEEERIAVDSSFHSQSESITSRNICQDWQDLNRMKITWRNPGKKRTTWGKRIEAL